MLNLINVVSIYSFIYITGLSFSSKFIPSKSKNDFTLSSHSNGLFNSSFSTLVIVLISTRSEERRVGKECTG